MFTDSPTATSASCVDASRFLIEGCQSAAHPARQSTDTSAEPIHRCSGRLPILGPHEFFTLRQYFSEDIDGCLSKFMTVIQSPTSDPQLQDSNRERACGMLDFLWELIVLSAFDLTLFLELRWFILNLVDYLILDQPEGQHQREEIINQCCSVVSQCLVLDHAAMSWTQLQLSQVLCVQWLLALHSKTGHMGPLDAILQLMDASLLASEMGIDPGRAGDSVPDTVLKLSITLTSPATTRREGNSPREPAVMEYSSSSLSHDGQLTVVAISASALYLLIICLQKKRGSPSVSSSDEDMSSLRSLASAALQYVGSRSSQVIGHNRRQPVSPTRPRTYEQTLLQRWESRSTMKLRKYAAL